MKKLLATSVVAIMAVLSTGARAESTAEGQGNAKAKLATGVVVEENEVMDFGTVTRAGADATGTVTLARTGVVSSSDDAVVTSTGAAGEIKITGTKDTVISSITYTDAKLSNLESGDALTVAVDGPTTADLSATGSATIKVGGSFTLAGGEADGDYSTDASAGGTPYKVTVAY